MSDSDSDDLFTFQSKINFDEQQAEKETLLSNDNHYNILSDISKTFFANLQTQNDFNHKFSWRSYSPLEPISITINTTETLPGICDLIKPNGNFLNKVLITFSSLFCEIENTLTTSSLNPYESLYYLSMYNENPNNDAPEIKDGEAEEQIARMLPYLNELYEKITKLLSIAINLFNQLVALYSKNNQYYDKTYKYVNFSLPFDYLSLVLSYFLAIDTIVSNNEFLCPHWNKYMMMFHNVKNNPGQFNLSDDNKKKLEKMIKKINACILDKNCFNQCLRILFEKTGEMSPSGSGFAPTIQNKVFLTHFTTYLKNKIDRLYTEIGSFTESNENIQVFQYMALLGLYIQLITKNDANQLDKNVLQKAWAIQKKIATIPIIGSTVFLIDNYLKTYPIYNSGNISLDPRNVLKKKMENFEVTLSNLKYLISNMRLNVMTWVTRMESDLFDPKVNLGNTEGKQQIEILVNKSNARIKLILNGLALANSLRLTISNVLETHVLHQKEMKPDLLPTLTTGIELMKVIQCEFNRMMPYIAVDMNVINRTLIAPIQDILRKVINKLNDRLTSKKGKSDHEQFYKDVLTASQMFYFSSQAVPSKMRRVIFQLCLDVLSGRKMIDQTEINNMIFNFWKIEVLNQLSKEVSRACDCSFLYWYQNIFPTCLNSIYHDKPKRLYFFALAVNDIELPLTFIKHKDNGGIDLIKFQRKNILEMFEDNFLKEVCREIETDLRQQIHAVLIEGLKVPDKTDRSLVHYLKVKHFELFDIVVDIKRYVEEYLNLTFYKMTTLNLNDWKTYQQMRVLAKSKYDLNLHEIFLPSQTLEQGKDILQIIRKLPTFVKSYTHNLHSQNFIEVIKDKTESNNVNVIGVQQILNSLYTHGTGIVNSVVNATYQFLTRILQKVLGILGDDYIKSLLKDERIYWDKNKTTIEYNYPYQHGEELLTKIKAVTTGYSTEIMEQLLKIVKQIGNAVALTRCIRTALMDYNSQNANLLTAGNFDDFTKMTSTITLEVDALAANPSSISNNMLMNAQNSFNDSNKMFIDTISSLKQTGENDKNYLSLLVTSFGDALSPEKIKDIDLFAFLFPALCITYIEKLIVAKENINKINMKDEDSYFSDDGFIVGMCYLLKIFKIDGIFESLNWFTSVITHFSAGKKEYETAISNKKNSNQMNFNISGKKVTSYLTEFEMLYYTYSSAMILFNE